MHAGRTRCGRSGACGTLACNAMRRMSGHHSEMKQQRVLGHAKQYERCSYPHCEDLQGNALEELAESSPPRLYSSSPCHTLISRFCSPRFHLFSRSAPL